MVRQPETESILKKALRGDSFVDGCWVNADTKTDEGNVDRAIFQLCGRVNGEFVIFGVKDGFGKEIVNEEHGAAHGFLR